jgi:hypothetical protein
METGSSNVHLDQLKPESNLRFSRHEALARRDDRLPIKPKKRWVTAPLIAVVAAALMAPGPALAGTETSGSLNCGSTLILSSERDNGTSNYHQHINSSGKRKKTFSHSAAYTWTYYNSGYTSVSSVFFSSSNTISNWGRCSSYSCGSGLVETSLRQNATGRHRHVNTSGSSKSKTVTSGSGYTWSYFTSAYTKQLHQRRPARL